MQRIDNYGSLLQSYALKSMLESLGHEVGFVDIRKGIRPRHLLFRLTRSQRFEKALVSLTIFLNLRKSFLPIGLLVGFAVKLSVWMPESTRMVLSMT